MRRNPNKIRIIILGQSPEMISSTIFSLRFPLKISTQNVSNKPQAKQVVLTFEVYAITMQKRLFCKPKQVVLVTVAVNVT